LASALGWKLEAEGVEEVVDTGEAVVDEVEEEVEVEEAGAEEGWGEVAEEEEEEEELSWLAD